MKLEEVTLENIKEYVNDYKFKTNGIEAIFSDNGESLGIYRMFGEDYIGSIYRNENWDFETSTSENDWCTGICEGAIDEEETSIQEVTSELLGSLKSGLCEDIDYFREIVDDLNEFGEKTGYKIPIIGTTRENEY